MKNLLLLSFLTISICLTSKTNLNAQTITLFDNVCFSNSVFTLSGQHNGRNRYINTDLGFTTYIQWTGTQWEIFDADFNTVMFSTATNSTPNPPNDGFADLNGTSWILNPAGGCSANLQVSGTGTQASLPVELTAFSGLKKDENIELNWQTASEKNNEGFDIQRSIDGQEWQNIGFVQGNGTTQEVQDYTFTDEAPLDGTNYYRLKQVDFDGAFEYSDIVTVTIEGLSTKFTYVFPNPVTNTLNVIDGEGQATIYNMLGQPIKTFNIQNSSFRIDTSDLNKGQYILSIQQDNGTIITKRFMK